MHASPVIQEGGCKGCGCSRLTTYAGLEVVLIDVNTFFLWPWMREITLSGSLDDAEEDSGGQSFKGQHAD